MNATTRGILSACLSLSLVSAAPALAGEVTVERLVKSGGIGGIGASESTQTVKYSGLKKREVSTAKLTGAMGGFLGKFAGDMSSDTITDIDRDLVTRIDHPKKTYTQMPITLPKEKGEMPRQERTGKGEDEIRIVKNEVDVKETGEKKAINGFDCTRYLVTWTVETENVKTKERSTSVMTTDLWNTPETAALKAMREAEEAFTKAYLKKLGLNVDQEDFRKMGLASAAAIFGGDETSLNKGMKEISEKMARIKGFPILTTIRWEAAKAGGAPQAPPPEQEKPAAPDLSQGFGGLLSGLAKKGLTKSGEGSGSPQAAGGRQVVFDSTIEVKRVDASSLPAGEFAPPAGYTKVN
jgi:hypothetical protein